ncbi:MAG: acetolactate synthase large subunit [Candidatus Sumerlaeia bacterium]
MKLTGSEIIVRLLERQGIEWVAGIPGGANLPLYDALAESRIRHVLARHEQGAGFIAHGLARATGQAAVCLGTSGPGATNLLTAIADARLDSIPIVAITGQVPTSLIGTDAFQEVDTYGLTLPVTKHNFLVRRAAELLDVIPRAFAVALSGRPGPVAIDVPKDVQRDSVEVIEWPEPGRPDPPASIPSALLDKLAEMIHRARRPIFYIGGGVISSPGAADAVRIAARRNGIPVTSSLMGLGAFPSDDPLFLGMLGMHGARFTNYALDEADLLIAVGVRFDDRATGKAEEFCRHAAIAHIDVDPSEIGKIKAANLAITGDAGEVLRGLLARLQSDERREWNDRICRLRRDFPLPSPPAGRTLHPLNFLRRLAAFLPPETIITSDVGQHQMWVAQVYPFERPRTWLTSGGLGTMGFGLPAAIGAALARADRPVVCISGDGSFLMNLQELATLAELQLAVKIVLMNNGALGLVRQQQELFYGERYFASRFSANPDFCAIARGFGLPTFDLNETNDPYRQLQRALERPGPAFIHLPVPPHENVLPMVPPGAANRNMIGGEVYA